jgi:hypothetical protein
VSALGRAAVRLAARTLPAGIRERYREEWLGDLEAAPAEGVNPAGIAVGALLFSATLNRDAPQLVGVALTALAVRHARRSIAFFGVALVLLFGTWINGQVGSTTGTTAIGGIVAGSVRPWRALAIAAVLVGLVYLWRAAMLASALAKVSAALATTGTIAIALAMVLPALGGPLLLLGCAALIGSGVCGLIVWSSAPQPAPVVAPPAPALRLQGRIIVLLGVGGTLVVGCSVLISGFAPFGFAILAIGAAVTVSLTVMRQRLSAPRTSLRRPWLTVALASLARIARAPGPRRRRRPRPAAVDADRDGTRLHDHPDLRRPLAGGPGLGHPDGTHLDRVLGDGRSRLPCRRARQRPSPPPRHPP